jgi:hypothetical protein
MKRTIFLALMILLAAAAAAQPPGVQVPAPEGWTVVDPQYRYGREDLWEYINGAAELFLSYRFRELTVADFERGDEALTVCVYDMGAPLDAYGIFETEKPDAAEEVAGAGAAALVQPPYRGLMIKDRFYVKIEAGAGDVSSEALAGALRDVGAGLPGEDALPPELRALPETDRIPGTVAFTGSDYLGLEDLAACLHADYRSAAGVEYGLFVMTPSEAFLGNGSGKWKETSQGDRRVFARKIPYRGVVVLMGDEERMVGVSGFGEVEEALAVLGGLED